MANYRSIRDLDWPLVILTMIICALGELQIYSATRETVFRNAWWKQLLYIAVGLFVMWLITNIDYHTLLGQTPLLYGLTIASLALTYVVGAKFFGSRRWIPMFGGFHLQVSEFAKLVIVLLVARYLTELRSDRVELRDLAKLLGLVGLPMLMVFAQPDLGTALTYLPILSVGVLLAGLRWQHTVAIVLVVAMIAPLCWAFVLKDYQKDRVTTFLDPYKDPRRKGYQVIQSKITIGSGGMWGKGVTKGLQTQLRFLPVPHTDFIFAAFAEEHGFVGVVVVLGLFFLLLMQIVQNAQASPDRAGMYICMGIAAVLLFHVLVNVGMVVGRLPVVGITLPLMSNGGSSMLSVFLMLGLVNNVRLRRFVN